MYIGHKAMSVLFMETSPYPSMHMVSFDWFSSFLPSHWVGGGLLVVKANQTDNPVVK